MSWPEYRKPWDQRQFYLSQHDRRQLRGDARHATRHLVHKLLDIIEEHERLAEELESTAGDYYRISSVDDGDYASDAWEHFSTAVDRITQSHRDRQRGIEIEASRLHEQEPRCPPGAGRGCRMSRPHMPAEQVQRLWDDAMGCMTETFIPESLGQFRRGDVLALIADLRDVEAEHDRLAAEVATLRGVAREDLAKVRIILAAVAKDSADWARNMPNSDRKWNLVHQSQALGEAIATLDALTSPTDGGGEE